MTLVVDTSAVMAIILDEPTAQGLAERLAGAERPIISAVSIVEATIVAEARLGPAGTTLVQRVVREAGIETIDVTADTALDALDGWRAYGKGRHRAGLNLGDCFTYALAKRVDASILCVGDDFARTDVAVEPHSDRT
jgi:ribonuclease VapC